MNLRFAALISLALTLQAAHLVYQTGVGGTYIATDSSGNAYVWNEPNLTKLDGNGNTVYSKTLALPGDQYGIAVDAAGNVLLVGDTNSDTLPTSPGVFQPKRSPGTCITGDRAAQPYPCPDAYVAKIDPNGNLAWASYLGGLDIDQANGVTADAAGNVYVTGFTRSSDFPILNAFQPQFGGYADAFVAKISPDGSKLLYSSFLGSDGYDVAHAIVVDSSGNTYITGELQGSVPSFSPVGFGTACFPNAINAFLIEVAPAGNRLNFGACFAADNSYSEGTALALDAHGNMYAAGETNSRSFPVSSGAFQNLGNTPYFDFVTKIAAGGGGVVYSALFNGGSFGAYSLAVDNSGNALLSGEASPLLPVAGPAIQPCPGSFFLMKLNATGSAALYSSFDEAARFAVTPDGSVVLAGAAVERLSDLETPGDSFLAPECVLNSASLVNHVEYGQPGISPGEIVALKGTGLGPAAPTVPVVSGGRLGNLLGGVQVFFDGVAAPLLYVQDGQINAVAPYEIAGQPSTSIQVQYQGRKTTPVVIPVSPISAALFQNLNGTPIVLNPDYSQNGPSNRVSRGGYLVLYLTGGGQTSPASLDGEVWQTAGGMQASTAAQITSYGFAGLETSAAPVLYAGPAPTLVSGVQQINVAIPADLPDSFVYQAGIVPTLTVTIGAQPVSINVYVQ